MTDLLRDHLVELVRAAPPEQMPRWAVDKILAGFAAVRALRVDAVSDLYWMHGQQYWDLVDDFPCVRPPFSEVWLEWRAPAVAQVDGEIRGLPAVARMGTMVTALPPQDLFLPPGTLTTSPEIAAVLMLTHHGEGGPEGVEFLPVGEAWRVLRLPNPAGRGIVRPIVGAPATHLGTLIALGEMQRAQELVSVWTHPTLLALAMLADGRARRRDAGAWDVVEIDEASQP